MTELLANLPPLLASHLELALVALAIACALGLPAAIAVADRPRLAAPIVAAASVVQTIPGLALLALMVPLLAWLGAPAFGFLPAVIALTLYALLPIVRNAIAGLRSVDASIVEAARGMGMTDRQILRQVELPLAAPVIAAGIRTATVWTVGAATLATPVGQPCLGNYIFAGLQTRNWTMLLVGVIASAALAIVLDALLGLAERALARRGGKVGIPLALFAALVVVVIALLPRIGVSGREAHGVVARADTHAVTKVKIGAKTFTEQYVLAEAMRQRLAKVGVDSDIVTSLGSTVIFDALVSGELDVYVDYSGTLWANQMKRAPGPPRWQVLAEVDGWLAGKGVRSLGSLGFENAYALAVRRDLGIHSIAELRGKASSIGSDYEFFGRPEWTSVRDAYGLALETTTFDPTLLYDAVARGKVDAIAGFSSDGRIVANDLVVLDDPARALPPYDAMVLVGSSVADDPAIACALSLQFSVDAIRRANLMVDRDTDKKTPAEAATWLLGVAPQRSCEKLDR